MHSRSISPPPVASSTMNATSLMIHAIEVDHSVETAQLDASALHDLHAHASVAVRRRQHIRGASELNHRSHRGRILNHRSAFAREKRQRVSRPDNPAAAICEAMHLKNVRIELAA